LSLVLALVTALTVSAAPSDPFADLPPGTPIRTYIVQPGDSPWSIAYEFYGNGDKYPIIYKYNGYIGTPPFLLTPGQVLKLPQLGLGPEAQIEWYRHDVKAKPPRALDWLDAREKMNLWRLYRVSTGDESAAHIVFEDASDLRLREQAMLVIYGASATAATTARNDKRGIVLEHGTLQGGLAKLDADAQPLVVQTPSGRVDILGKLTQIQAESVASMISAFDGAARVTNKGVAVEVAEGQGTVVEKNKAPEAPRPLPAAPSWPDGATPSPALVVALPGAPAPAWEATWLPVASAETYRVELAASPDFKEVVYDAEVGAGVTKVRLEALSMGTWHVRVSTRDTRKLESKPGIAREIVVAKGDASRRVAVNAEGVIEAVGMLELRAPAGMLVADSEGGDVGPSVRLLEGRHAVRWIASASGASSETQVDVLGVTATLAVDGEPLGRDRGDGVNVQVEVRDSRGRLALVPGLAIDTTGGEVSAQVDGAEASAHIAPLADDGPGRMKVRARWAGGVLAERELSVEARPARAEPEAFTWKQAATLPYRRVRGLAQAPQSTAAQSGVSLDSALADLDGELDLELALRGEWAVGPRGRFAADAGFVFQDLRLTGDTQPASTPGDLWLGARYALLDGGFALSPYLQVALPVGHGQSERAFTFEPGVLIRVHASRDLFFDLRAAALARVGDDTRDTLAFDGLAALTWGPVSLSYRAVLDGELASTIGLGAAIPIGHVRLGCALGYGLDDNAQRTTGGVSGRLFLDVGIE